MRTSHLSSVSRGKVTPVPRQRLLNRDVKPLRSAQAVSSLANDMALDSLMRDACAELGLRPWTASPRVRASPALKADAAKEAEAARARTAARSRHNFEDSPRANVLLENARLRETNAQLEEVNAMLTQQRDELDSSLRMTLEEHDEMKRALFDDMVELIVELEGAHALIAELETRVASLAAEDSEIAAAAAYATQEAAAAAARRAAPTSAISVATAVATAAASGAKQRKLLVLAATQAPAPSPDERQFAAFLEEQFLLARDVAKELEQAPAGDVLPIALPLQGPSAVAGARARGQQTSEDCYAVVAMKAVGAGGAAAADDAKRVTAASALLRREQTRADLKALQHSFSNVGTGVKEYAQMRALCFPRVAASASGDVSLSSMEPLSCGAFKHAFKAFLTARHRDILVADATLDAIFEAIDVDCDGVLSQRELLCGLVPLFNLDPIGGAAAMFQACDNAPRGGSGSGTVSAPGSPPLSAAGNARDGLLQLGEFEIAFRSITAVAALRHPEKFTHVDNANEVGAAHARMMFAAIRGGSGGCGAGVSDGITKAQFTEWFVECVSRDAVSPVLESNELSNCSTTIHDSCDAVSEQREQSAACGGIRCTEERSHSAPPPRPPPSGFADMIDSAAAPTPLSPVPDTRDPVQGTALLRELRIRFHGRGEDLETSTSF